MQNLQINISMFVSGSGRVEEKMVFLPSPAILWIVSVWKKTPIEKKHILPHRYILIWVLALVDFKPSNFSVCVQQIQRPSLGDKIFQIILYRF